MGIWRWLAVLIAASIVLPMSANAQPQAGGNVNGNGVPIKIGLLIPTSGPIASFGESLRNGFLMALKNKTVHGSPIEVILYNNNSAPNESAAGAAKLIRQDGVVAIVGCVASSNTIVAARIAQAEGVPMLGVCSTNDRLDTIGNCFSRVCFSDWMQGIEAANMMWEKLAAENVPENQRTAAMLVDTQQDFCMSLAHKFKQRWEQLGGQIVREETYATGDAIFRPQIAAIKTADPKVIFLPGYYTEIDPILRQAASEWGGKKIIGGDGWDSPSLFETAGDALRKLDCYMVSHFATNPPLNDNTRQFIADYKAKFNGAMPDAVAALGFDAGLVLLKALDMAGTAEQPIPSRDTLRKKIREVRELVGVTGTITIGDSGTPTTKSALLVRVTPEGFKAIARPDNR